MFPIQMMKNVGNAKPKYMYTLKYILKKTKCCMNYYLYVAFHHLENEVQKDILGCTMGLCIWENLLF